LLAACSNSLENIAKRDGWPVPLAQAHTQLIEETLLMMGLTTEDPETLKGWREIAAFFGEPISVLKLGQHRNARSPGRAIS